MPARPPGARAASVAIYLIVGLMVVAVLWSWWAQIDVRVGARGRLINPSQNIVLRPLESGVLREVIVQPGQIVRKGQVIATLDPTFAGADLSQLSVRELSLRAQVERLREQAGEARAGKNGALGQVDEQRAVLVDRQAAYAARLKQLDERIARLAVERESAVADQKVLTERLRALQELEGMFEQLVKDGYGSRTSMLQARDRRLDATRELTASANHQLEVERDASMAKAERAAFVAESRQKVREELAEASRDSGEVGEQLLKAQRRSELVTLTAPQDAVVLEVRQTAPGSVLSPNETFALLVPLGGKLLAEVDVAAVDVGEIRLKDEVRLKIDAFPFQRFGVLKGKVVTISGDAFTQPANDPSKPPVSYRVIVAIDAPEFTQAKAPAELLPGMTTTAEIVVGQRTVLSYFLYPLIRVVDEAIRER
jgi:HlyD family secretion protein